MLNLLFKRRYNVVDGLSILIATDLFVHGNVVLGLIVWVGGIILTHHGEKALAWQREREK